MALADPDRQNPGEPLNPAPIPLPMRMIALHPMHPTRILFASALLASVITGRGQGQVAFANGSLTLISTNAVHGGPALGPTQPYPGSGASQFFYALFGASSTVTAVTGVMDANWIFTGAYASNTAAVSGGRLAGGDPVLPAPFATGSTANFLVRGWSASVGGLDWPAVQAFMYRFETDPNAVGVPGQLFNTSVIATIIIGGPALPTPVLFGLTPGQTIQGFLLDQVPTPEPSVLSLFVAGGFGVALDYRMRKRRTGRVS
jgi:hypothetical protein